MMIEELERELEQANLRIAELESSLTKMKSGPETP